MSGVARAGLISVLLIAGPGLGAASEDEVRRGKRLFDQPWREPAGQDLVGPLFNARACADCHPGGGAGAPGGPALVFRTGGDPMLGRQLQPAAIAGITPEPQPLREVTASGAPEFKLYGRPLAARLAPGLRGLGLLARIVPADLAWRADPDDHDGDGISGRLGAGRFGSKAEHGSLTAQIAEAMALDLGLATASHPSAAGDCTPAQSACLVAAGAGAPVSAAKVALLTAYVAALRPKPAARPATGGQFVELGCDACHAGPYTVASDPAVTGRPSESVHPYSDLLLHDLGPGLADPFPSPTAEAGEWRTAPLWGLRSRQRFLHDGRATTLREAILWHVGEAERSRERFRAAPEEEQEELLAWLATL